MYYILYTTFSVHCTMHYKLYTVYAMQYALYDLRSVTDHILGIIC